MNRFTESVEFDAWQDKIAEAADERRCAMREFCERDCDQHNENCPWYDPEQESWDCDECFNDKGWD